MLQLPGCFVPSRQAARWHHAAAAMPRCAQAAQVTRGVCAAERRPHPVAHSPGVPALLGAAAPAAQHLAPRHAGTRAAWLLRASLASRHCCRCPGQGCCCHLWVETTALCSGCPPASPPACPCCPHACLAWPIVTHAVAPSRAEHLCLLAVQPPPNSIIQACVCLYPLSLLLVPPHRRCTLSGCWTSWACGTLPTPRLAAAAASEECQAASAGGACPVFGLAI